MASSSAAAASSTWTTWTGGVAPAHAHRRATGRDRGEQRVRARADDRRDAQAGRDPIGPVARPVREQAFAFAVDDRGQVRRARPQRRILGDRHRVVRPRAVDRGARRPHDLLHTGRGRRVEDTPRAVDVDPREELVVGQRADRGREMHDRRHVRAGTEPGRRPSTSTRWNSSLRARRAGSRTSRPTIRSTCGLASSNGSSRCPRKPETPVTATTISSAHAP